MNTFEKYRKRPIIIEAVQLTEDNKNSVFNDMGGNKYPVDEGIKIGTLEGDMIARWGDYIIKGIEREFYPCKPDIFKQSYEKVEKRDACLTEAKKQ